VTYRKIFCSFQRNFSDKILIPFIGGRSPSREGLPKEIEFFKAVRKFIPPTSVMAPSTFLSQKKKWNCWGRYFSNQIQTIFLSLSE
jgi:hypothetical protein